MTIVQITPGAGGMFCGNCFRDNALVASLRGMGHHTLMVPLYLPMALEENDQSEGTPIFFGGINVYLQQKAAWFGRIPHWLHRWLDSPVLLKWAAGRAAKTRAEEAGELTLSMLRGENGNQVRELNELIEWIRTQPKPDVICLSNALLIGLTRQLKRALRSPVVCMLQGEDSFLDALPAAQRSAAWRLVAERGTEVDLFVAPSRYFADLMSQRLGLGPERVRWVPNGIRVRDFEPSTLSMDPPAIGFFARMCREKGLDVLVDAFLALKKRGKVPAARLRVGGAMGPSDRPLVEELRNRLGRAGVLDQVEFCPNLDRAAKVSFFTSLTVFSTPATYSEAFGLYVIEAMAAGVPVVQPRHAAFPEIVEATGGGVLYDPSDPEGLSIALEQLLLDPARLRALGESARRGALQRFTVEVMAKNMLSVFAEAGKRSEAQGVRL